MFTIYSGFFLAATLISFFVAFLAWQRRTVKGASDLTWLMISAGIWTFFIVFDTAAGSMEEKVLWAKLGYIGAVATPVLYLTFILRFTGNDRFINKRNSILLAIIPLATWIVALTNDNHQLLWSGFSAISERTNIMEYYHGAWFWIGYMAYNYVLLGLATAFIFLFILKQGKMFRTQGWAILVAGLFPWTASVVYLTGINPVPGLDIVPFSLILSGILFGYNILNNRFLDLVPVARGVLMETLPDGIIALDDQNRVQDINQSALALLGIPGERIIGSTADSLPVLSTQLLSALISREASDQLQIPSAGGMRTLTIQKKTIDNQPGSRLIVIRDITDEVTRQREIIAGEERYRQLSTLFRLMADNMPDMLWAKDLDKKYLFANKAICEQLLNATDTEEPIGKTDLLFALRERMRFPERADWHTFGELCQDSDQIVIDSGKSEQFDEYGNVQGKFLYLDVRKAPIYDDSGGMIGVVGSARDITRQKATEEEINRRDVLLSAIAEATALLVQGDDLELAVNSALEIIGKASGANRVYIFQNSDAPGYRMPFMSQQYEWTDGTVEPQIDNTDLQNVPYEIACPRWFETLSAGKVIAGNIREFPEGERISLQAQGIVSILVTPVFIDKAFWGFIGFDDCIQEREWAPTLGQILTAAANTIGAAYQRKKSQDELVRAKEKAEESDRLKSAFLANMSHEIRTPMNGILGFAELLKEPDLDVDEQLRYISIIEKSGNRLLSMINNIVDISKIESGQMQVSLVNTNILELLEYIRGFFNPEVTAKGLTLGLNSNLTIADAIIRTDKEKVYAILINLVKNSIKFTSHGGIEFGARRKAGDLEFFVRDTGIGIAHERLESIFNRFVQGHPTSRQMLEGAGLGLSISRAYAEMLGGHIWVESEEGIGSVFYFTIPCSHAY